MNSLRSIKPSGIKHSGIKHHSLRPKHLFGLIALLLALLVMPQRAFAHALDAYLQATYITVSPTQIVVELDLTPGVLVAPQMLAELDTNGDQEISEAEGQVYVDAMLSNVVLNVDGQPVSLAVTRIDMPTYLTIQAGYGTIRIFTTATLADGMKGTHQIAYMNNFAPTGSTYQVNAFVDKGVAVTLGKQNRDSIQQGMTMDYVIGPVELATDTSEAVVSATVEPAASATTATTETATLGAGLGTLVGASGQTGQLLAYLYEPTLSPWLLLIALALAGVVGGLHALTPGHGKTLVAAYLVGSRGTVQHAVALGAIVTFTHTASVIVIGLLALFASQFIVPDVLVPILEICAGLLVVLMGVRLVWQRWGFFRQRQSVDQAHTHEHDASEDYSQGHDHGDGRSHSHLPPAEGIKMGNLMAMGVSGGLVPCPEALGIMVIAIGLNRILLGLGLIVSFSLGLAVVLIVIGILLVRSRSLIERFGGLSSRWSSALPLCSALIVTVLGAGIVLSGLVTYLGRG